MRVALETVLDSILLRTLEAEPSLNVVDGIKRVMQLVPDIDLITSDLNAVEHHLKKTAGGLRQRAVLNPYWLEEAHDEKFYFYLVNSQPGWLHHLTKQIKGLREGVSHFILYGVWDSLILLCGTEDESKELLEKMQLTTYYDLTHFSASSVPLFHHLDSVRLDDRVETHDPNLVNALVGEFDKQETQSERIELQQSNAILGPAWEYGELPIPRIVAFVGISLRGGSHELSCEEVLKSFLQDDILRTTLVHLFEIDRGYPFHYFAKLVCQDTDELDRATDAIGFARIGRVGLEGSTFIVASGKEEFPMVRSRMTIDIGPAPDLRHVEEVANQIISDLGSESVSAFNSLDGTSQLVILRSLDELHMQASERNWDDKQEDGIRKAIESFARASLEGARSIRLDGAVMLMATTVESFTKHCLRRTAEAVYGKDYARAQKEFKLATKDFRRISLGKAANAFRTIKGHHDFAFLTPVLEEDWLDRFERFADLRNTWAHGGVSETLSGELVIDDARRALIEGIELVRWFGGSVLPTLSNAPEAALHMVEVNLPEKRGEREFGIFLSHSTLDKEVAESIAIGLKALKYPVWYADWAIGEGESIVQKINEGLMRNDTLVVLLSPSSVTSKWVQRELGTALMAQLSGQNVRVVPILIAECDIPTILSDIKYIDMVEDFQAGFVQLLEFLRQRGRLPEKSEGG